MYYMVLYHIILHILYCNTPKKTLCAFSSTSVIVTTLRRPLAPQTLSHGLSGLGQPVQTRFWDYKKSFKMHSDVSPN